MKSWKDTLLNEMTRGYARMDQAHEDTYATKAKEIGLVHPTLGTGMILRNSGAIDTFADYSLGVRLDPETNTLSVYAPTIALHTDNIIRSNYEKKTYFSGEIVEILENIDS